MVVVVALVVVVTGFVVVVVGLTVVVVVVGLTVVVVVGGLVPPSLSVIETTELAPYSWPLFNSTTR